jgi:hypothetical protein
MKSNASITTNGHLIGYPPASSPYNPSSPGTALDRVNANNAVTQMEVRTDKHFRIQKQIRVNEQADGTTTTSTVWVPPPNQPFLLKSFILQLNQFRNDNININKAALSSTLHFTRSDGTDDIGTALGGFATLAADMVVVPGALPYATYPIEGLNQQTGAVNLLQNTFVSPSGGSFARKNLTGNPATGWVVETPIPVPAFLNFQDRISIKSVMTAAPGDNFQLDITVTLEVMLLT